MTRRVQWGGRSCRGIANDVAAYVGVQKGQDIEEKGKAKEPFASRDDGQFNAKTQMIGVEKLGELGECKLSGGKPVPSFVSPDERRCLRDRRGDSRLRGTLVFIRNGTTAREVGRDVEHGSRTFATSVQDVGNTWVAL